MCDFTFLVLMNQKSAQEANKENNIVVISDQNTQSAKILPKQDERNYLRPRHYIVFHPPP